MMPREFLHILRLVNGCSVQVDVYIFNGGLTSFLAALQPLESDVHIQ